MLLNYITILSSQTATSPLMTEIDIERVKREVADYAVPHLFGNQ